MFDIKFKWYDWILVFLFGNPILTFLLGMVAGILFWVITGWLIDNVDIRWE